MLTVRKARERGHADHGWLNTYHTFSFGNYYDPRHMGIRSMRVINDDILAAGKGFPFHGHADMEILSYVTEGALEHKDSMGNTSVIRPGDVQLMSAGTGVEHSEFNHLTDAPTHLFQIWIRPAQKGLEPSYAETHFEDDALRNQLRLIVSPDGRHGSLRIHQDAQVYAGRLGAGAEVVHKLGDARHAWVQVLSGGIALNGTPLEAGDGAALEGGTLQITSRESSEILVFDLN